MTVVSGSIGTTSATIAMVDTVKGAVTVRNTHASNSMRLSYNAVVSPDDFALAAGASITYPRGLASSLQAIGSADGTTYTIVGEGTDG